LGRTYNDLLSFLETVMYAFTDSSAATPASMVAGLTGAARLLFSGLGKITDIAGNFTPENVAQMNKNSLEAMAESARVLTMKMWTGWHYKYVVITGLTIEKSPVEDSVFRATLQLQ
jgi:hypothetical protein